MQKTLFLFRPLHVVSELSYSIWFDHSIVVTITALLHSTKPELRVYAGSRHACGMSEIYDGEDLLQHYQPEISLNG